MNILEQIVAHKHKEIATHRGLHTKHQLIKLINTARPVVSLKKNITLPGGTGIIAEFKRKSPSAGTFSSNSCIINTTQEYIKAGAGALSILTDYSYFGGSNADLQQARQHNTCPILRKDFIIDPYQILEARAHGADAILLIAAILTRQEIEKLTNYAHHLNMEVILEVHNKEELNKINNSIDIVGVNNRNLKTQTTNVQQSFDIVPFIPSHITKISESGINDPKVALTLKRAGFDGFLIGEHFLKQTQPEQACANFINAFKQNDYEN